MATKRKRESALSRDAYQAIPPILVKLRERADLSQSALSTLLGRPRSYVYKFESGERRLDVAETFLILDALRVKNVMRVMRQLHRAVRLAK